MIVPAEVAARVVARMDALGLDQANLRRATGLSSSTLSRIVGGASVPATESLFPLSDALQVSPRWLITGKDSVAPGPARSVDEADFVWVPRFDLFSFSEHGKPEEIEATPIRRDWLFGLLRRSSGLWFADMPPNAVEDAPDEGVTVLCEDAARRLDDRGIYVFWRDGDIMVRRVLQGRTARTLVAKDAEPIPYPDPEISEGEQWTAIAKVVATFGVREL